MFSTLLCRMAGNNLNYFLVSECPLPHQEQVLASSAIARLVASLNLNSLRFAPYWLELTNGSESFVLYEDASVRRQLRAALDAVVAHLYGVDDEDLSWILRGCGDDVS